MLSVGYGAEPWCLASCKRRYSENWPRTVVISFSILKTDSYEVFGVNSFVFAKVFIITLDVNCKKL